MSLLFDDLVQDLKKRCTKIAKKYPIAENATFTIDNILMSGFALFSIKDSSLAKFIKKLKDRKDNLKSIFKITQAPSDTALRTILDGVPTSEIQNLFVPYVKELGEQGVLSDYKILGNLYIPLDGTRHHSSQKVYCDCCLTTHHQNGTTTYHHDAICACIVHPNHQEVFPIGIEEVIKQDGQTGDIKHFTVTTKDKKFVAKYANGLILNGTNSDIVVNFLYLEEHDLNKGTVKIFSWITDILITTSNHTKIAKIGRSRWKIENETFNTLKNQGYEFEHNFGHGHQFLAANFAVLMLLSFLFDQIQQRINRTFKLAKLKAGSRVALWEKIRQYFDLLPVPSMDFIYQLIIGKIKFKVQYII